MRATIFTAILFGITGCGIMEPRPLESVTMYTPTPEASAAYDAARAKLYAGYTKEGKELMEKAAKYKHPDALWYLAGGKSGSGMYNGKACSYHIPEDPLKELAKQGDIKAINYYWVCVSSGREDTRFNYQQARAYMEHIARLGDAGANFTLSSFYASYIRHNYIEDYPAKVKIEGPERFSRPPNLILANEYAEKYLDNLRIENMGDIIEPFGKYGQLKSSIFKTYVTLGDKSKAIKVLKEFEDGVDQLKSRTNTPREYGYRRLMTHYESAMRFSRRFL